MKNSIIKNIESHANEANENPTLINQAPKIEQNNTSYSKLDKRLAILAISIFITAGSLAGCGSAEEQVAPTITKELDVELDIDNNTNETENIDVEILAVADPIDYKIRDIIDGISTIDNEILIDESIDYTIIPENLIEVYSFKNLTPEQQAEIKEIESMSIEEYFKLPEDIQLKYSYFVFENNKPRIDYVFGLNEYNMVYNPNPKTPEDFANNYAYISSFITTMIKLDKVNDVIEFDYGTAMKLLPLRDEPTEITIKNWSIFIDQLVGDPSIMHTEYIVTNSAVVDDKIIINTDQLSDHSITMDEEAVSSQHVFEGLIIETIRDDKVTYFRSTSGVSINNPRYIDLESINNN